MTGMNVELLIGQLATQLAELREEHVRLAEENARQAEQLAALAERQRPIVQQSLPPPTEGQPSRRQVLTRVAVGAAATLGAGVALERAPQPAAAASGGLLTLGQANLAEAATQLAYDGATPIAGKILLLANDSALPSSTATYPAALAGWAGGGRGGVATGVAGQTSVAAGNGVVGSDLSATGSGGVGVRGSSRLGIAVYGASASSLANARAVVGVLTSPASGGGAAAIWGQSNGAGATDVGVYGAQAGSGSGVWGSTQAGKGVLGTSTSGIGVLGQSSTGAGVAGTSAASQANATAVVGILTSTAPGAGAAAVRGQNNGSNGNGYGVYGSQAGGGIGVYGTAGTGTGVAGRSTLGVGVYGESDGAAPNATGVLGVINSPVPDAPSIAVRGQHNGTGADGIGVYGAQAGSGIGVYGIVPSGTAVRGDTSAGIGVLGFSTHGTGMSAGSSTGPAVFASSGTGTAVIAKSGSNAVSATAILGVLDGASPGGFSAAVRGQNKGTSAQGIGVWGEQFGSGWGVYGTSQQSSGAGVIGQTFSPDGNWAVYAFGNIGATGTKSALVPAENGLHRTLYCLESPECWFEDFGSAQLVAGGARVSIEPLFAATVQTDQYHIFLTPHGDSRGLYVSSVDAAGFTVQEQQGGRSTLAFSYRVVARRKDVTAPRLAAVQPPRLPGSPPLAAAPVGPRPDAPPARGPVPTTLPPRPPADLSVPPQVPAPDLPPPLPPLAATADQ